MMFLQSQITSSTLAYRWAAFRMGSGLGTWWYMTTTTKSSENGATTLSRMNFSGYEGHVTRFG